MTGQSSQYGMLPGMDFDEAVGRLAATEPSEVIAVSGEAMKDGAIEKLIASFEDAARVDETGSEYWTARDLAHLLEYADYRNFLTSIERAKVSCSASGQSPEDHFVDATAMIAIGKGGEREVDDLRLSRYACYLVAQNADARKQPVAFAQTYFAIQTRRQELRDRSSGVAVPQSEDEKRVFLREQIKEHNRYLSSAAKNAGVVTPQDFAIFHSKGYQGLYGRTVGQIRQYKGLSSSVDILDRMGSTELAANFFRVTQTEEKLRKEQIRGKKEAFDTHYAVGRQVRDAMLKISGIAPEDLAPADSIKAAERRIQGPSQKVLTPPSTPARRMPEPIPEPELKAINLRDDLWKYALLVMVQNPEMQISTTELIKEIPKYILIPEEASGDNNSRKDSKFSQLVRNLKSHKTSKTNFIYLGYAESIDGGMRATAKGRDFVTSYFRDYMSK